MWILKQLIKHSAENKASINGYWVPARPINYTVRTFAEKLREAYLVFTGKADAFTWPEGQ